MHVNKSVEINNNKNNNNTTTTTKIDPNLDVLMISTQIPDSEVPLTFATFYYSLKVTKGKDEREDVQKKTFAKWINSQLQRNVKTNELEVKDLFIDLKDGRILIKLLEILTGKEIKAENGQFKVHHMSNVNIVLSTLRENGIRLINISAIDIVDGNPKLTLGLVWNIIQHWQVRDVLRAHVTDIHTTNLENTLLTWCQNSTKGYKNVDIKDFTKSWRNGLAFNALIHKYRPNLFDYSSLIDQTPEFNLDHAFKIAHTYLNIERLLDIEDVTCEYPDKKSIMMYVMCYFQVLSQPNIIIEKSKDASTDCLISPANSIDIPQKPAQSLARQSSSKVSEYLQHFERLVAEKTSSINRQSFKSNCSSLKQQQQTKQQQRDSLVSTTPSSISISSSINLQSSLSVSFDSVDDLVAQTAYPKHTQSQSRKKTIQTEFQQFNLIQQQQQQLKPDFTTNQVLSSISQLIHKFETKATLQQQQKQHYYLKNSKRNRLIISENNNLSFIEPINILIRKNLADTPSDTTINNNKHPIMNASLSSTQSSSATSPTLDVYLNDLERVIKWLSQSEDVLLEHGQVGNDVNTVKAQFQTHEDFMLELTKHQNNVGQVLHDGSKLINSGSLNQSENSEVVKQMKLLNDKWESLRLKAVDKQAKLHDKLMKLQTEQLNQMDDWLSQTEKRIENIYVLGDSLEGLEEQKQELSQLQDDLIKEQEAVDCLKQIIVVVDDNNEEEQSFNDLENRLSNLSDRWSNVCKFVGTRWFIIQELIAKLNTLNRDFDDITLWINDKSTLLKNLNKNYENSANNVVLSSNDYLIKLLKEIELDMQEKHVKLNQMNDLGEHISTQLNNSPQLASMLNSKMDILEAKWNDLLNDMEILSKKCNNQLFKPEKDQQQQQQQQQQHIQKEQQTNDDVLHTSELIKFFNKIELLINSANNIELNLDEQQENIKKALIEIQLNEPLIENFKSNAQIIIENKKNTGEDTQELEINLNRMEQKWSNTKQYVEDLQIKLKRNSLQFKINEELATLKEVYEGYQRYIHTVEPLSQDSNKININIETNKVKLKGMKSYETRLQQLKQLAYQLENKELTQDIENFLTKWFETYSNISNRNDEIDKLAQSLSSTSSLNTSSFIEQKQQQQQQETTGASIKLVISDLDNNNMIKKPPLPSQPQVAVPPPAGFTNNIFESSLNDEDIVHVVTNVFQIPLVSDTQTQTHTQNDTLQSSQLSSSVDQQSFSYVATNEPKLEINTKTTANTSTSIKTSKRIIDENGQILVANNNDTQTQLNASNNEIQKTKYQIRSIVEIYENPNQGSVDVGVYKTESKVEEIHRIENKIRVLGEDENLQEQSAQQLNKAYMDAKQLLNDRLANIEKTLISDDFQYTFINILEEKLKLFKELQKDINEQRQNYEYIQRTGEDIFTKSTTDLHLDLRRDLKSLKHLYAEVTSLVTEKVEQYEIAIRELNDYFTEFNHACQWIVHLENQIKSQQIALGDVTKLNSQLDQIKLINKDIGACQLLANKLNDIIRRLSTQEKCEQKFLLKTKTDLNELNEKLSSLSSLVTNQQQNLNDALKKTSKIDNELEDLEAWLAKKERELSTDEVALILTEELFNERFNKAKEIKNEFDRKESQITVILESGQDMLKNSTGTSSITELTRSLISINTKWTNLSKKIELKYKLLKDIDELIKELKQLLNEENKWLDKVQLLIAQTKIGADAEELSEAQDNLERLIKTHSHVAKDRIAQLSSQLTEKRILIPLVSQDTKEFSLRWARLHQEAEDKLNSLTNALNDIQNWERNLHELQEWIVYTDRYIQSRLDQEIFADCDSDDFARLRDEFANNEIVLSDLESTIHLYRTQGKHDAAKRLDQQLELTKKQWTELNTKFRKFQKPSDFDGKLEKMRNTLDEIDQALHSINVYTEDPDKIHQQLEKCMKFYKILAEIKADIEATLKLGRTIVDRKQVDNTTELTAQLDKLKHKYNELGSRVTNGKNDLEKAFKYGKKFRKECNLIEDFLSKIDQELKKIEQKPLSKNYIDELDWIKNTNLEITKVEKNLENLKNLHKSLCELVRDKSNTLTGAFSRITSIEEKLNAIVKRLDSRYSFIQDEAKLLEQSYQSYLSYAQELLNRIESDQHKLIEIERTGDRDYFIEMDKELGALVSEIENLKLRATELSSKSEQYSKIVETELKTVLRNFEDLTKRFRFIQERLIHENITTTTTTRANQLYESKYSRNRRDKSPSESSVDSTVDIFDPELRQKYMRAVAYLRILDEAPIAEEGDDMETIHTMKSTNISESVDIEFVIRQARQVAQINEKSNPERARRILEKAHKLEQRWSATKCKRESLRHSSKIYEKYKEREGDLTEQISYLEQHLSQYKFESNDRVEPDWEPVGRLFYGPSDFIYEHEARDCFNQCQHQQQQQLTHRSQMSHEASNFDARSVYSEPPISRSIVQNEPVTVKRIYKTTRTTTTTQLPSNGNSIQHQQQLNQNDLHRQQLETNRCLRSSSIPPKVTRQAYHSSSSSSRKQQESMSSYQQHQQQQQQHTGSFQRGQLQSQSFRENTARNGHANSNAIRSIPIQFEAQNTSSSFRRVNGNNNSVRNTATLNSNVSSCIDNNNEWRHPFIDTVSHHRQHQQQNYEFFGDFKTILRQLEELQFEAVLLNELNDDSQPIIELDNIENLIQRWYTCAKHLNLKEISEMEESKLQEDTIEDISSQQEQIQYQQFQPKTPHAIDENSIMSASITELTDTVQTEKQVQIEVNSLNDPNSFLKCLDKLSNSLNTVEKHLNNIQKPQKEFYDFEKQDIKLNAMKDALESLGAALKTSNVQRKSITDKSNRDLNKRITKLLTKLTKEHQEIVQKYKQKNNIYLKNYDKWKEFNKDFDVMEMWLRQTIDKINDAKTDTHKIDDLIKDFNNLTNYRLLLERTNLNGHEILTKSSEHDSILLNEKLSNLNKTWKYLITCINELKESKKGKNKEEKSFPIVSNDNLMSLFNNTNRWISQVKTKIDSFSTNEYEIERTIIELEKVESELPEMQLIFNKEYEKLCKNKKTSTFEIDQTKVQYKQIDDFLTNLKDSLAAKKDSLKKNIEKIKKFQEDLNVMSNWMNNLNFEIFKDKKQTSNNKTPSPPPETIDHLKSELQVQKAYFNHLKETYEILIANTNFEINEQLKLKMENLVNQWTSLERSTSKRSPIKTLTDMNIDERQISSSISSVSIHKDDIEIISNDLLDWLLWIEHTLQSQIVTVGDLNEIQQGIQKFQSILNEVTNKETHLVNLSNLVKAKQDSVGNGDLQQKFLKLESKWNEKTLKVKERKNQLECMLNECHKLDQINFEFINRIQEMENKVMNLPPLGSGYDTLKQQKIEYKEIRVEINHLKQLFEELREVNQTIIDKYLFDDTSKIRVKYERLVTRFNELSMILLNRGNNIMEALQIIEDFDGTLLNFSHALNKIEKDLNYLEDYLIKNEDSETNKQTLIDLYKELQREIDNHNYTYSSINQSSQKIINSFKEQAEKELLSRKIDDINKRWLMLRKKSLEIRSRLESNTLHWSALITSLNDLINWCKTQHNQIILKKKSIQPDSINLQRHINEFKVFMCNIEYKKSIIESTINSAKLFYNDKKKVTGKVMNGNDESDDDDDEYEDELIIDQDIETQEDFINILSMDEIQQAEFIVNKVEKKLENLQNLWRKLNKNTTSFNERLIKIAHDIQLLNRTFDNLNLKLNESETQIIKLNVPENIDNEQLAEELDSIKCLQNKVASYQALVDDMSLKYNNFNHDINQLVISKNNLIANSSIESKYQDLIRRWTHLTNLLQEKYTNLYNFIEITGANIFLKLNESVQQPWQRGILSHNKLPYYINHSNETTSWEHPKMIELYKSFNNLNDIRFSAYRTAMKLRTLQKRLWLDFVEINDALEAFDKHNLKSQLHDRNLEINKMIQCLSSLFQSALKRNAHLVNLVHAVDLTLNWLLSVYDPSRCGQIRVLSIKIAIVILCKGSIEEKYKYLFNLVADENGQVTERKLALLLYDIIMIPKQLGEVAAFGGSNVEPSVRSCFEYAKNPPAIVLKHFLDWLKLEPQSIVWLPVLHRLAVAENARHDAKCSICKEYPIVGFRYRSLKLFNFDICQNCFFSGRKIKGFKFDHPLLEYYTPTSSADDIKDFFRIFRNKFRSKRNRKLSKLGYLPVQTVMEGDEFDKYLKPIQSKNNDENANNKNNINNRSSSSERTEIYKVENSVIMPQNDFKMNSSTSQFIESDDEHFLIAQYCQKLNNGSLVGNCSVQNIIVPSSYDVTKSHIGSDNEIDQQMELENVIKDLEDENKQLIEEYSRLQTQLNSTNSNATRIAGMSLSQYQPSSSNIIESSSSSSNVIMSQSQIGLKENQIIEEARLLRQHEGRLEARMKILENHNRLLDTQLKHLRFLLNTPKESSSKFSTMSVSSISTTGTRDRAFDRESVDRRSIDRLANSSIGTLFNNVEDITRAINNLNNLVNVMNSDK